jgi:hypothetical protein
MFTIHRHTPFEKFCETFYDTTLNVIEIHDTYFDTENMFFMSSGLWLRKRAIINNSKVSWSWSWIKTKVESTHICSNETTITEESNRFDYSIADGCYVIAELKFYRVSKTLKIGEDEITCNYDMCGPYASLFEDVWDFDKHFMYANVSFKSKNLKVLNNFVDSNEALGKTETCSKVAHYILAFTDYDKYMDKHISKDALESYDDSIGRVPKSKIPRYILSDSRWHVRT